MVSPHTRKAEDAPCPSRTEAWAQRMQRRHWGTLTFEQRLHVLDELCLGVMELSLKGLRLRHPAASAQELELRAACVRIGREAVEKVLGRRLPFEA